MLYFRILSFLLSLIWTSPLLAYNFRCDKNSINCLVDDKNLTVGDYAGFFDGDGRIVAVGQVTAIKNGHREVEISETFNRITRNLQVRMIPKEDYERLQERFPMPRRMFPKSLGLAVSYAELLVLDGFKGQEYDLFFAGRLGSGFSVTLRSLYMVVAGTAIERKYYESERRHTKQDITIQGLGLTSGIAYEALPHNIVSLRGELGLGLMAVDASVGDNATLQTVELDDQIQDGINALGRASGSAILNITHDWHLELMLAINYIRPKSFLTSLGLGIVKDL